MKKIFTLLLVIMFVLSGCSKAVHQNESETQEKGIQETAGSSEKNNDIETPSDNKEYDPEEILFIAESDADDDDIYYCFNYRGELLEETDVFPEYYSSNGLMAARGPNGRVGFADEEGLFVIEPIYYDATPFSEDGYSRVVKILDEDDYWNSRYIGVINDQGEEIIPCKYDALTEFYDNGYCLGTIYTDNPENPTDCIYHVLDKTGNICFESTAPLIEISKDYIVERNNGIFIIYDYDGNKIYTQQQEGFKGDVHAVTKYSGISIIDNYGADDETDVSIGYEFIDGELKEFSKITSVNNEVVSYEYEDFSAERVMSAKTATGYVWVFEGVDIPIEYELFWVDGDYIILYKNESSGFSDYSSAIYDVKKGEIVGSIPYYIQIDGRIDKLEGYYYIKNEDDRGSEGWCVGVADINGNVIIEPIYETVIPFVS